jgi:NhaA family Na+:H+ antiporter
MIFPALFYVGFNWENQAALRGWAIPTATDIAFALGVLSLFGPRVPASLKIFLAALPIIDDLGAVVVIALFYTNNLNLIALAGAAVVLVILFGMNRAKVLTLWPYLALGVVLWLLVFLSRIHATLEVDSVDRNGDASIADRDFHSVRATAACYLDRLIFGAVIDGVRHQVREHLCDS